VYVLVHEHEDITMSIKYIDFLPSYPFNSVELGADDVLEIEFSRLLTSTPRTQT